MWIYSKILWIRQFNYYFCARQLNKIDKIFIGYDCGSFPLGLNALDNSRENEIRLQLYQSYKQGRMYRCGEFDYLPVVSYEFSRSLSYWLNLDNLKFYNDYHV